jgi:hypothetical protein
MSPAATKPTRLNPTMTANQSSLILDLLKLKVPS